MNTEQVIDTLRNNSPIKLIEGYFEKLQEWDGLSSDINIFEIERVGRGFLTADLFHIESEEVYLDVPIQNLTNL